MEGAAAKEAVQLFDLRVFIRVFSALERLGTRAVIVVEVSSADQNESRVALATRAAVAMETPERPASSVTDVNSVSV